MSLKPGYREVFEDVTMYDNWSGTGVIDGPGNPDVYFTSVAAYGDSYGLVKGAVSHVVPKDYLIAVYIKVGGGWWTMPTFQNPTTMIS